MASIPPGHVNQRLSDKDDSKSENLNVENPGQEDDKEAVVTSEEKVLLRKLDRRILPIVLCMYIFAYLDRSNLGNARLQGLPADILGGDVSGRKFDWINSVFFFPYILCQVPATLTSKLLPPRLWLGGAAIGWGLCSTLMSTGFSAASLLVCRIGLGTFEACFAPGIPIYFSLYYTKKEIGLRLGCFFGGAAVAGSFGGLIAYGIGLIHAKIQDWRLLFIVEGIPAIFLGVVAIFFLPNRPDMTTFLNEDERTIAISRLNRDMSGDKGYGINKFHVYAAFKDWTVYLGGFIYFGANVGLASMSAFLPTIITTFGYSNANAQLLTVPPYAVSAVVLIMASWYSDHIQSRGVTIACVSVLASIGYLLLLLVPDNIHVRYFACFCITSGTYTTIAVMLAWFAHNLASETKRATGTPMYMAIGQCGSVLGSHLFPNTEGPRYIRGFAVSCATSFFGALCAMILTIHYRYENARKDRLYGKHVAGAKVDTSELADKAPEYRYIP